MLLWHFYSAKKKNKKRSHNTSNPVKEKRTYSCQARETTMTNAETSAYAKLNWFLWRLSLCILAFVSELSRQLTNEAPVLAPRQTGFKRPNKTQSLLIWSKNRCEIAFPFLHTCHDRIPWHCCVDGKNALQHSLTPDFLTWSCKMIFEIDKIQNRRFAQEYKCCETENEHASNPYRLQHVVVHTVWNCHIYHDSSLNIYASCM